MPEKRWAPVGCPAPEDLGRLRAATSRGPHLPPSAGGVRELVGVGRAQVTSFADLHPVIQERIRREEEVLL